MPHTDTLQTLRGKLIVSCQASAGDPLDDSETLCRMASAVLLGGAGGLRAESAANVAAFRTLTQLPILGIVKCWDSKGEVYITPDFASAAAVSEAGADIVALDCTRRRLVGSQPWPGLIPRIQRDLRRLVCADIATLEDAVMAQAHGADMIATTLCGYTDDTREMGGVNWDLLRSLVATMRVPVLVEGHIVDPHEVTQALRLGAHAVVVGSAITRPQTITARFVAATHL